MAWSPLSCRLEEKNVIMVRKKASLVCSFSQPRDPSVRRPRFLFAFSLCTRHPSESWSVSASRFCVDPRSLWGDISVMAWSHVCCDWSCMPQNGGARCSNHATREFYVRRFLLRSLTAVATRQRGLSVCARRVCVDPPSVGGDIGHGVRRRGVIY